MKAERRDRNRTCNLWFLEFYAQLLLATTACRERHWSDRHGERVQQRGITAQEHITDPASATDLQQQGVTVRVADSADVPALTAAIHGVDALLLITGSEVGQLRAAGAAGRNRKNSVPRCSRWVSFARYSDTTGTVAAVALCAR